MNSTKNYIFKLFLCTIIANLCSANVIRKSEELFPLSIIHVNDFHARFEETNQYSSPCNDGEKCIGGYARLVTVIKELQELRKDSNPIYLNAGDNFQGTLWYNIGRWNVTSYFLNLLKADAVTLGNHEFDHGVEGVVPFLQSLQSPMVVANIDDSEEPTIQGKYNKSVIIEKGGRKIGIIGVIVETTDQIADTGHLKFLNESKAVRKEAQRLKDEHNVDIIIALSHCGLDVDRVIAKNGGPYLDVIVGGHSHTFLYTGDNPPGIDHPRDNYPVEIVQDSGRKVLIVQASAYTKYVGDLTVYFNEKGDVVNYEGAPIYIDSDIVPDPEILRELQPWKEMIDAEGKRKIGSTKVFLTKENCNYEECNLGNLIADSMIYEFARHPSNESFWTEVAIALINTGGIRTSLNKGDLTFAHLMTTLPFENDVIYFDLQGKYLLEALEYSVNTTQTGKFSSRNMLQVSGLRVTYNVTNPVGKRVVKVEARCQNCLTPKFYPLNENETYRIVTPNFLGNGGDGFFMLRDHQKNVKFGRKDIDAFVDYVKILSPIYIGQEGRIEVVY